MSNFYLFILIFCREGNLESLTSFLYATEISGITGIRGYVPLKSQRMPFLSSLNHYSSIDHI